MTIKDIELKVPDGYKDLIRSFIIKANRKSWNLFLELNGKYNNRVIISDISPKWNKTEKQLLDKLHWNNISEDDIKRIYQILVDNGRTIIDIVGRSGAEESLSKTTNQPISNSYHEETINNWSYEELRRRYDYLRAVTLKNFPIMWKGLEFALSVKRILNIKNVTLPFPGIMLGPPSSTKTLIVGLFKGYKHTYYTDNFSPKALVSHNTGVSEEKLKKIDMLPKIASKFFLTPELAPIFSAKDDDLIQILGILTRVADGEGYENDTGACGHRGYDKEIMFVWLGAAVDIPYKVHKLLATLGAKLYFFRLPRIEESEDTYYEDRNSSHSKKKKEVWTALHEYLHYFDANPEAENTIDDDSESLKKIAMDYDRDEELAHRVIIRVARLLARLRAVVPTWETKDTQGSAYSYGLAKIEDPSRAITQLRNLARGHALSQARKHITIEDVSIAIHTALSTATIERVSIFDLLLANKGVLTTNDICDFLNTTSPTARRTMTELKAIGLVTMEDGYGSGSSTISPNPEFSWFLTEEFASLKEKKPPQGEKNNSNSNSDSNTYDNINIDTYIESNEQINEEKNISMYRGDFSFNKVPEVNL